MKQKIVIHDLPECSEEIKNRFSREHIEVILNRLKPKATENNFEIVRHCLSCACSEKAGACEPEKTGMPGLVPGPPCPHCSGEFYIRTGVCLTCYTCGESSSCG